MTATDRIVAVLLLIASLFGAFHFGPPWLKLLMVVVLLWSGFLWLCRRHPYVAIFIIGFLRGLLGGRR